MVSDPHVFSQPSRGLRISHEGPAGPAWRQDLAYPELLRAFEAGASDGHHESRWLSQVNPVSRVPKGSKIHRR